MIGFREIESALQNERHFTGESYIALFQGDVRDNAKRFSLCRDAIFMLRYLGVEAPGCYYESALLIFNGDLVEKIKEETVIQSGTLIPGCLINCLFSCYGTRFAWRFMKVGQKLNVHGRAGLIAKLPRTHVSILILDFLLNSNKILILIFFLF